MEEVYAKIAFVELAPDILVPYEWPVGRVYDVVLSAAKEVIMQNTQEDPVLQVDGVPARLYRYVRKHRFYHVFKKIPWENVCGCYVYDIALTEYQNKDRMKYSSGTNSCDDSKSRRTCSYPEDYTISHYYVPHINGSCSTWASTLIRCTEAKYETSDVFQRDLVEFLLHDRGQCFHAESCTDRSKGFIFGLQRRDSGIVLSCLLYKKIS